MSTITMSHAYSYLYCNSARLWLTTVRSLIVSPTQIVMTKLSNYKSEARISHPSEKFDEIYRRYYIITVTIFLTEHKYID